MKLTAYKLQPDGHQIITGPPGRPWMDKTHQRSAYHCLPMLIANQNGWLLLNDRRVCMNWNGEPGISAITFEGVHYPMEDLDGFGAMSHFGSGIVSFTIPYLFRTSPGYNLLVRGPANHPKDGISPLEGVVETDWTSATFTMNWKITRKRTWITFEPGEPIAMIVPQQRGLLEQFEPDIAAINTVPALRNQITKWQNSRSAFNEQLKAPDSGAAKQGWQKEYFQAQVEGHQRKLRLQPFE
jgi:hypothetical protein